MTLELDYWVETHLGHVRDGNEDAAYAGPRLLAVADGMGGHAAGEVASRVVIATLAQLDEDAPSADILGDLRQALEEANTHLAEMVAGEPELRGMGTTTTAILASGQRLGLAHIGDSRGYLYRDGALTQITHDHTYVQELVDAGDLTAEQAASHPQRSMITRAMDGRPDGVPVDLRVREALLGDRYLLCSDGLSDYVSEETIGETMALPTPRETSERLVGLALRAGGKDNITAIVADVVQRAPAGSPAATTGPQIVGAANPDGEPPAAAGGSPASRAAALLRRPVRVRRTTPLPAASPTRRFLRPAAVIPLALLLLVAGLVGFRVYLDHEWYVGVSGGRVVVFRGVPGSVAGLHLQQVTDRLAPATSLGEADRRRVEDGIDASGHADALAIAHRLSTVPPVAVPATPTPAPSTPTPAPTPAAPTPATPTPGATP